MDTLAIVASLPEEMEILLAAMQDQTEEEYAALTFHIGTIGGRRTVITKCGVAKVNAARTVQALIDHYRPDALIHTGVAGGLNEKAPHLSLVISDDLVYHDVSTFWLLNNPPYTDTFKADEKLRDALLFGAEGVAPAAIGRMATGDVFVHSKELKNSIAEKTHADCVDMETCASAHTAHLNGVPFCAIKCISDPADDSAPDSFNDFLKTAADRACQSVLKAIEQL